MKMVGYPALVDQRNYSPDLADPEAYYGLPQDIIFCANCGYSNQKPNSDKEYKHTRQSKKPTVAFDEQGVCSACRVAEKKAAIDWAERQQQLRELCDRYRRTDGGYDCIVPGSGGKDSFYAAHKLKYEYGMNPLTVTWSPHIYTDWGWRNFQAWIHAGFDNYLFTPNGRVHRLLTRLALEQMFHPFQPFIMGQMYFPPKIAAQLNIPLVFYGENPTEYGNAAAADSKATKDWDYFTSQDKSAIHLAGTPILDLRESFGLTDHDLAPYMPPNPEDLKAANIDVHYLGYYLPWHPQECYYYSVEHGGFQAAPERTAGTYSKYSSIDDKIDDLHYYTTFIKFGIGRATYDSSQEVRNGELDRDEAIRLIRRFDGEYSTRFEKENFEYLSLPETQFPVASKIFEQPIMDRVYFERLTDSFRSPHLWKIEGNKWKLRRTVYDGLDD
ncbi:N-acetyl sugar amidotransferase [Hoeflea phototrophica DFL-43]|jgi:N-acetyl sugar amidotransferase|uniref:N-acetyl sugar amidotransferase n=1 Tax=Hoeflea phototrophica (strain DSM 17068 / NCIMB 14078 / DFL-43) TaxID=411684 RepID=A9CZU7_HOEPD|nr:N-acetyl sugar amidotransferase [Hoeflea phototrophica]EDQ34850.1 N-acetyl sugar amidotransferase [Hoeflea phototrophica DFL-43]